MFYLCFCYNAHRFSTSCPSTSNSCCVHVAENVQQRPLGSHFSVGRRIQCNTGVMSDLIVWQFKIQKIVGSLIVVRFIMFGFELPLAFCGEYENYKFLETL